MTFIVFVYAFENIAVESHGNVMIQNFSVESIDDVRKYESVIRKEGGYDFVTITSWKTLW